MGHMLSPRNMSLALMWSRAVLTELRGEIMVCQLSMRVLRRQLSMILLSTHLSVSFLGGHLSMCVLGGRLPVNLLTALFRFGGWSRVSRWSRRQANPLARLYGVVRAPAHCMGTKLIDEPTIHRPQDVVLVVVPEIKHRKILHGKRNRENAA